MAQPQIRRGRARRGFVAVAWLLLVLVIAAAIGVYAFMRASLPILDGQVTAAGLRAPVTVTRDALGVATLHGSERYDIAFATGYLHAQERFFQMDLLRRAGSGELAALLGNALLPVDRERRIHRFGARAGPALAALPEAERAMLERYAAGVNAGLEALAARPFEYAVLRATPRAWRAEDTLLVVWAMYFDLQDDQLHRVWSRGWLRDNGTSPEQLAFLLPTSSTYDAPLDAATIDEAAAPMPATPPAWFARPMKAKVAAADMEEIGNAEVGSNNWVVAGSRSKSGAAIVANDMHLVLRLPNLWYRAAIELETAGAPLRRLVGVTLPGTPAVVAGSNGQVAWGLTNSYGAYVDLLELELDPKDPTRYRMAAGVAGAPADGWGLLRTVDERIAVAHGADEILLVQETAFGPVWERGGRRYAVHWVAHDPGAVNFAPLAFEQAANVGEVLAIAQRAGFPAQNLVAGDAAGHIGWTIAGALPGRSATWASTFPAPAASAATHTWTALAGPTAHPRVIDPASGQLVTANSRQLGGAGSEAIGDGGADLGARQRQLRDDVTALGAGVDEAGIYGVGLDDRALYLAPWRDRALQALAGDTDAAAHPRRDEFKHLLESTWTGRASVDSVAYRLTRGFVGSLYLRLFGSVDDTMRAADKQAGFSRATARWPAVIARLLDEKPPGWLPAGSASWQAVQLAAIDDTIESIEKEGAPLAEATWGKRNTVRIVHPMAAALPLGARWLAAPADQLPGDSHMPRVAAPDFGQSERLVVSPGREASGVFNMPGGQSGHPLSPNFLGGHADWVAGRATPLLPGAVAHTLNFVPR
ncbi:MAG: penicillin acylase family protein [Caldimonas sp.]